MQPWFLDAKLGIFVHWGIYSVDGVAESWSFFHGDVSHDAYFAQLNRFTAARYDPDAWADLFVRVGADYAVLTAKHHDGVALFDTAASDLSVAKRSPAGRDLVGPFVEALRDRELRVGLYFSHLDWSHPDYPTVRPAAMSVTERGNPYAVPAAGHESPERWQRFLAFHRMQLAELLDRYQPDLLWFDGDWERDESQWRMAELREFIRAHAPYAVINGRMLGHGDYATPEQGVPIEAPDGPWELCLTMNDSWGWQPTDTNYKSPRQLVRTFVETIGGGGTLLLDVGPREDGVIVPEQTQRLDALGSWVDRHRAAVYGTRRGLPHGHFYGPSTMRPDGRTLYLFVFDRPNEYVALRGVRSEVVSARTVGTNRKIEHTRIGGLGDVPGWTYLYLNDADLDPLCTVLELTLATPLDLHRTHARD